MVGLPGAGKSTLAALLAPRLDAVIVDRDAIRARLFPGAPVSARRNAGANARMAQEIAALLRAGRCVIADGRSFATGAARQPLAELAATCGVRCDWIWLDLPAGEAAARIAAAPGTHPASDRTPALPAQVAARFEPPSGACLRLDARQSPQRLAQIAWAALGAVAV